VKKRKFDLESLIKEVNQLRERHKISVHHQRMALNDIQKLVELKKNQRFHPGEDPWFS
jgi:hypothetical protein